MTGKYPAVKGVEDTRPPLGTKGLVNVHVEPVQLMLRLPVEVAKVKLLPEAVAPAVIEVVVATYPVSAPV